MKYLLYIFFISSILSCKSVTNDRFHGFEKAMNVAAITGAPQDAHTQLIHLKIPADSSKTSFDYNKRIRDVRFVPLETNARSVIGKIDKIFFASTGNIIIADLTVRNCIIIFDSTGKFINTIAASEKSKYKIAHILNVAFDYNNNHIVVHDNEKNTSLYFDDKGSYLRSEKEYIEFGDFANIKGSGYFTYLNLYSVNNAKHIPVLAQSDLYIGKDKTELTNIVPQAKQRLKIKSNYQYASNLSSFNSLNQLFYTPVFSDTVFAVKASPFSVTPKFKIDFPGTDLIEVVKSKKSDKLTTEQINEFIDSRNYYLFDGKIIAINDSTYFITYRKNEVKGYFYFEKTNRLIGGDLVSRLTQKDSVQLEFFDYPIEGNGSEFVGVFQLPKNYSINQYTLYTQKYKEVVQNRKPQDENPILYFYKVGLE